MKILLILLMFTGCGLLTRQQVRQEKEVKVTEKIEKCVQDRINDGVNPIDSFKICDSIYRGVRR